MSKTAILAIKIIGDGSNAANALGGVEKKAGRFGGAMKALGGVALAGGAALVGFGAKAITAGGNLEQSIGAIDTVFKGGSAAMHQFAQGAAKDLGLARNEYNELATIMGTQLKNGGTSLDELGGKTHELMTLGADLASMFGGSTADAVGALSSALKGERDPIERYGVSLKQATIDAKAAELGFTKVGGALSNEAQQAATLALIMQQTTDAHGNFAKESTTWNGQLAILKASFGTFTETVGLKLLPAFTTLVGIISANVLPGLESIIGMVDSGIQSFLGFTSSLTTGTGALTGLQTIMSGLVAWWSSSFLPAITTLGSTLVTAFNTARSIVTQFVTGAITVLKPLVPGFMAVFRTVGDIATGAIKLLSAVITAGLNAVKVFWNNWGSGIISMVGTIFRSILGVIQPALNTIKGIINTVLAIIKGDWRNAWTHLTGTARSFISTITGIFSGAKNILTGAGRAIIDGLLRGIKQSFEKVKSFVGGIAGWIRANKGPIAYDRGLLKPAGTAIMGGLISSMTSAMPRLENLIGKVTNTITGLSANPRIDLTAAGSSSTTARPAAAAPINITINGAVDPVSTARQIRDLLRDLARTEGRTDINGSYAW